VLTRKTLSVDPFTNIALAGVVLVDVVLGAVLRFWTTSKLWLDEAQSVNISSQPLSQLVHYLRNDGAPPLYYSLLHVWMGLVGHSDFDVRSLSGVLSVLALGAAYGAARRWWGNQIALVALAVLAVLPFAVYYGTETRMYALVMLESATLLWVLRCHLDRPRWGTAVGVAVIGAALLYTQYWGIYLLLVVGCYVVLRWWFVRAAKSLAELSGAFALAGSLVLWLPWLPIFYEQKLHTGTPWSLPPGISQIFTWIVDFTENQSVPHVIASVHSEITLAVFLALAALGVLGSEMTRGASTLSINVIGDPRARAFAFIAVGTMVLGIIASHVDGTAYEARYAAVIVVPLAFLVARGVVILNTPLRILVVLVVLSGACLWTDRWGITVQRTQAGQIASALQSVPKNSIVFVCPDQLGPSLLRYANPSLTYVGYPRMTTPFIIDWYSYLDAFHAHTAAQNALREAAHIASSQPVYIVRAPNYEIKLTCWYFTEHLAKDLHRVVVPIVKLDPSGFYQAMEMQELKPATN
jgi:mannosyltransferase